MVRTYKEENICKNPSPVGNPFFDIEKLNALAADGWKLAYIYNDQRFLVGHIIIKALFYKDTE